MTDNEKWAVKRFSLGQIYPDFRFVEINSPCSIAVSIIHSGGQRVSFVIDDMDLIAVDDTVEFASMKMREAIERVWSRWMAL